MTEPDRPALEARALHEAAVARAELLASHAFLAVLALRLDLVPVWDFRCPTAATDGRRLFVRPDWFLARSASDRVFIIAHEVMHCALMHGARTAPGRREHWNIAMDHEVNHLLVEDGFQLPRDAILLDQFRGFTAEQVYDLHDFGADDEHGHGGGGMRGPNADVHLDMDLAVALFAGLEVDPRFGPLETDALEEWPARVRDAARHAKLNGHDPLGEYFAVREKRASMPWRELLAAFVVRTHGGSSQWIPPSTRYVHRGLYLPSRRTNRLRVVVAVDTSGSTLEYLGTFLGEIVGILGAYPEHDLTLLACDAAIHLVETYDAARPLVPSEVKLPGGGGTDLRPPFAWVEERGMMPQAMVYLTDGFGPAPERAPPWPVLWVLTEDGQQPAPWGESISLPPPERLHQR